MKALAVIDKNRAIGRQGGLLFRLPTDLAHFKKHTLGRTVVMGRRTLESLPGGKPLPRRNNLVLSASMEPRIEELKGGWIFGVFGSEEALRSFLTERGLWDEAVISGGSLIYAMFLEDCSELVLTEVEAKAEGADVFFPEFRSRFHIVRELGPYFDGELRYYIRTYEKNV